MNKYIPEKINGLDEYIPDNGSYMLRADANESPFLPSEKVMNAFREKLGKLQFDRYPDSEASELISAFAKEFSLVPEEIAAGNGSDELISLISSTFLCPGDKIMVLLPDFSMYSFYAKIGGAEVIEYQKHDDFNIDFADVSKRIAESGAKAVLFSNPCNPTGRAFDRETVVKFIQSTDALVVVDEAYMEFCREGCSVLDLAGKLDNLIVLKTLSKAYGMAALRCGFAVGDRELITALKKVKSPYNLNSLTQKLCTAVLENSEEIHENIRLLVSERDRLYSEIARITENSGMKLYPSDTNFVLLDCNGRSGEIFEKMKADSVKIRLMGKFLRITACEPASTDIIIKCFEKAYLSR